MLLLELREKSFVLMNYGAFTEDEEEIQPFLSSSRSILRTQSRPCSKDPRWLVMLSVIVMISISALLLSSSRSSNQRHTSNMAVANSSQQRKNDDQAVNVILSRVGYIKSDGIAFQAEYEFLNEYDAIIEPFVDTELRLLGAEENSTNQVSICTSAGKCIGSGDLAAQSVWVFRTPCTPHDKFDIIIEEFNGTKVVKMHQIKGICLYVRREFRSLTTTDRERFLNASYMLSIVSEEDGQRLYGPHFHSYGYLVKFHYFNSAWQDADHIHEGNGFLVQHIKITNIFEASIQSVDPSVCVPYWDFTIDSALNSTILNSYVTQSDTHGMAQLPINGIGYSYESGDKVTDGRILDGRWSNLKAEINSHFLDLRTGYGYLRSPWNLNPSPYVSRYTLLQGRPPGHPNFPSCTNHYELLQVTNMMDFFFDMQLLPHGAVHIELGGTFGCEALKPMLNAGYILDEENLWGVCRKWFIILKEGYRSNYFLPAHDCVVNAMDPTLSECPLICTPGGEVLYYGLFSHVMGNNINTSMPDSQHAWYHFICTQGSRIFTGDHLESASPADPSFWVIHPTLERLLHAKLMTGGFSNEAWPADVHKGFVCNKARCYSSQTGTKDFYPDCCYGHYEYDQMFDGVSGNRSVKVGPTNRAVLDATDPRKSTYSMPYIYDQFSWSHCAQDISALLRAMKANFSAFANASSEYQYNVNEEKIQRRILMRAWRGAN